MPLVWTMPDGSICVTQIVEAVLERERREGETTDQVVLRLATMIQAKTPNLAGGIPSLVKSADMPRDRTNRDAWRLDGAKVSVRARD